MPWPKMPARIELAVGGVTAQRRAVEGDAVGIDIAEHAEIAGAEGVEPVGARLGYVAQRILLTANQPGPAQCAVPKEAE